jgi:superfamily II DNA or RNA helicase
MQAAGWASNRLLEDVVAYTDVVLSTHAFVKKYEVKNLSALRDALTVKSKYGDKAVEAFAETKTFFGLPLYYQRNMQKSADSVQDLRSRGERMDFQMTEGFQLRENQKLVFDNFCNRLQNGVTGFLLEASTGWGKTSCCLRMLQELHTTVLVIVPRDALLRQWIEAITTHTDLTRDEIGIAQQGICDFSGKKIVVGMIHSLAKDKYPDEFKKYFGAVVWDEVHVTGAETFSRTIGMFPSYYRFGVSATPDRKDGMQDVFRMHIRQVHLSPNKLTTLMAPKVLLRSYKAKAIHPYLSRMKDVTARRGKLLTELAGDLARNALIGVYIKKFSDSGRRVLVISDRIEQLKFMRDLLAKRHQVKLGDIGLFTSKTSDANRKIILKSSKVILATYGVMSMGIDVPDLRALVFATPLSDVAQVTGRILRLCSETKEPVVFDIVDTAYSDCVRWAGQRQAYYRNTAKAEFFVVEH